MAVKKAKKSQAEGKKEEYFLKREEKIGKNFKDSFKEASQRLERRRIK